MSYSVEPQLKKSKSFSKYLYSNIDQNEDFFIFDIKLSNKKKFKKIKKIKNLKSDYIIDETDKINFKKYTLMEITVININNVEFVNNAVINIENLPVIYNQDSLYFEISNNNNYLKCFYNFNIE